MNLGSEYVLIKFPGRMILPAAGILEHEKRLICYVLKWKNT